MEKSGGLTLLTCLNSISVFREFEIIGRNPFESDLPARDGIFYLEVINGRHVFLIYCYRYRFQLTLLKLDCDKMEVSALHSEVLDMFDGIIFDEQNPHNFVIYGVGTDNHIIPGRIVEDKFELKHPIDIEEAKEGTDRCKHFNLVGGSLYVLDFYKKEENRGVSCVYCEIKLFTSPNVEVTKLFEMELEEPNEQEYFSWPVGSFSNTPSNLFYRGITIVGLVQTFTC